MLIEIKLKEPAKIDGVIVLPGHEPLAVEEDIHAQLLAAGAIFTDAIRDIVANGEPVISNDQEAFNLAVAEKARALADSMLDEVVRIAVDDLQSSKDATERELAETQALLKKTVDDATDLADMHEALIAEHSAERQKSADLVEKLTAAAAEIDALKGSAAAVNTPVAKTAAKKGAATS